MSKMDELRALREAAYARRGAPTTNRVARSNPPRVANPPATKPAATQPADAEAPDAGPTLCGHRNMSGRTCTREQGHAAKTHRYS